MAEKQKKKAVSVPSKSQFAETIFKISYRFSLAKVFDDFLTMAIAACTQNPQTKLSYYEAEYLQTIAAYKDSELRFEFPKAFSYLIEEMEARVHDTNGNDVVGELFEQHISNGRNGQFFTPFPICQFMASVTASPDTSENDANKQPLRILDPACGSGRMLVAAHKIHGSKNQYYGIDIDRVCVKMTALNLFLNGIWNSEVMCANALLPDDYVNAYRISLLPLGIFKIEKKEECMLWHLQRNAFTEKSLKKKSDFIISLTSERSKTEGTQMDLFK